MKKLYAPWRSSYAKKNSLSSCVFCDQFSSTDDEKHFIIKRYIHCALILNLYPYNAGHVMVIPYAHVAQLNLLSQEARAEIMEVISIVMETFPRIFECQGMNMGINSGKPAGGSIPDHLHVHLVPRWIGDTNFLAVIADTKPISFDLTEIYKLLTKHFQK